jgi:hypothetical protein
LLGYSQIGTEEFPVLEIINQSVLTTVRSMQVCFNPIRRKFLLFCSYCCLALHKQFKFQVATQFFMICRTAAYVLTAVLTLDFKLLPDSYDLLPEDSQLGAERRKQCHDAGERGATLQDHCGTAFQVAHRIAPFMQLQVSLQRPARI